MYAANTYVIRLATDGDDVALRRLAQLDSSRPLSGQILIGEIGGVPAAALSLTDRRTIADPFVGTTHLVAAMRSRAIGLSAYERTPALRERLLAGLRIHVVPRAAAKAV
jgi:hypothetical protein